MRRCHWVNDDPLYIAYHDNEWGKHTTETRQLFEALTLELMQSGLSFLTVLKKREALKTTFFCYDLVKLSQADTNDINLWLTDPTIIRHKKKLEAVSQNAEAVLQIEQTEKFYTYLTNHIESHLTEHSQNAQTLTIDICKKIVKKMKQDGFKFIGPTTLYSFFQATGFINDHDVTCNFK